MELLEFEQIFNEECNSYIGNDKTNYFNKLLKYAAKDDPTRLLINKRIEELKTESLKYIIVRETDEDHENNISKVRRTKLEKLLSDIDNYMMSLTPYNGFEKFAKGDLRLLINDSVMYCELYRKRLLEKIQTLKNQTILEYNSYIIYKDGLDALASFISYNEQTGFLYSNMGVSFCNYNKKTPLYMLEEVVDKLSIESRIINKFGTTPRKYICSVLDSSNRDLSSNSTNYLANICDSILMNYSLLSIYSDNPEGLVISNNMMNLIMFEINSGMITKEDVIDFIQYGNIRFDSEELEYIKTNFIDIIFDKEEKKSMTVTDLLKMVK